MKRSGVQKIRHLIKKQFSEPLSLADMAKHAFVSPFHFQRIFKESTGESPTQYLTRVRLEAAAHTILTGPQQSMLAVALDCGYNSLEHFSRAFKKAYGVSPSAFRDLPEAEKIQLLQTRSQRNDIDFNVFNADNIAAVNARDMPIEVVKLPAYQVITLPTTLASLQAIEDRFEQLMQWASARDLVNQSTEFFGLVMDYPLFTALDKCHYLVAMTVTETPDIADEMQAITLPAATYARIPVRLPINEMMQDMTLFWKIWLPQSGYRIKHETALHWPQLSLQQTPFCANRHHLFIQLDPA